VSETNVIPMLPRAGDFMRIMTSISDRLAAILMQKKCHDKDPTVATLEELKADHKALMKFCIANREIAPKEAAKLAMTMLIEVNVWFAAAKKKEGKSDECV
jgi:hypothetical protein